MITISRQQKQCWQAVDICMWDSCANIEASYPTHKGELLKSLSKERCEEILLRTKILQKWVKEKL